MKKIVFFYLLGALFFSGCVRDEFDTVRVEEGIAARVRLEVVMPVMGGADTRAVAPDVENRLESLRVLIFNSGGTIVTNRRYTALPGEQLESNLGVDTYSGSNYTFCFIANSKDAIDSQLADVTSYDALKDFMMSASMLDFGLNSTDPLVMTAVMENVTVRPGASSGSTPVLLRFLAAKVTLKVIDRTESWEEVTVIGWDVEDASARSYLLPNDNDANPDPDTTGDKDEYWLTTAGDFPFESEDKDERSVSQTFYLLENRRGGRVDRALPGGIEGSVDMYEHMGKDDGDSRGKAWYKPKRATSVTVHAMHKTTLDTKRIKASIYLGGDNHSNYDILRGSHYQFTVTVYGVNDIRVDTNIEYTTGDFFPDHPSRLWEFDAHPDFKPIRMFASRGKVTAEILDSKGRTYDEPGFDATWLKISPLNLMYHQVKQAYPYDEWQQAADPTSRIVRPKYIPHKSVREKLAGKGGWNTVPTGLEDDDSMAFADATYRMCYKITDIPFQEVTVTDRTIHVYADEFLERGSQNYGSPGAVREASLRLTYYKDGAGTANPEVSLFPLNQMGYISVYTDDNHPDAGLLVLNEDGTPSNVRKKMVAEWEAEYRYPKNQGIPPEVQYLNGMQWGFDGTEIYTPSFNTPAGNLWGDKLRNGKFMTANLVYTDVQRVNNEATDFGTRRDSYRPMYGVNGNVPLTAYSGTDSGDPYYYPDPLGNIYHPIYKSSAARYCHEKNRDLNGDGIIDESETHWYLPSMYEFLLFVIAASGENGDFNGWESIRDFSTSTEFDNTRFRGVKIIPEHINDVWAFFVPSMHYQYPKYMSSLFYQVRCFRELD
ncbi:fimbrial protein [Bacteroides hominis]|uniref:DUF4906 domain-containing protein n=1 Tax=Bacteroides hominis TaxID=2763023 RepID=UPI003D6A3640